MILRVPDDLIEHDQWVLWRYENCSKVPYQANGRRASTIRPAEWGEFETVLATLKGHPRLYAGLGFVFTSADPFCGIDLDNCLAGSGQLKSWASGIIERFADTYMENSPSGRGVKIFCKAKLPAAMGQVVIEDGGIELYDRARYFAVTGRAFRGAPRQVEDHAADIMALYKKYSTKRGGPGYEIPSKIPVGARHNTLVSIAGTLRSRGVCDQAIEALLHAMNRYQCEQPEPSESITRIVTSSQRWRKP